MVFRYETQFPSPVRVMLAGIVALCVLLSAPVAVAQTGPAGVGNASGASSQPQNALWLRADQGVTSNTSGITEWQDQSGNGNTARAATGLGQPQLTRFDHERS